MIHSYKILNRKSNITTNIPIKIIIKETNTIMHFNSIKNCAKFLNMSSEHLGRLLNGRRDFSKSRLSKYYVINYDV